MRAFFVNQFFFLFCVNGIFKFINVCWNIYSGTPFPVFQFMDLFTVISFFPVFIIYIWNQSISSHFIIPIILASFWTSIGFWPIYRMDLSNSSELHFLSSGLLLLVAIHNQYLRVKATNNPLGIFTRKMFTSKFHVNGFFLKFSVIVFLSIIGIAFNAVNALRSSIIESSHGWIVIDGFSISIKQRVYSKDRKRVYLIGMSHIGSQSFYDNVLNVVPEGKGAILLEGVTDKNRILVNGLDYSKFAEIIGSVSQAEALNFNLKDKILIPSDIDFSELEPSLQNTIIEISKIFNGDFSSLGKLTSNNHLMNWQEDLIFSRNKHLLEKFDENINTYDIIVIPWGAAHAFDLSINLEKRGFQMERENRVEVWKL